MKSLQTSQHMAENRHHKETSNSCVSIRISNVCNAKCLFCLESSCHDHGNLFPFAKEIKRTLRNRFIPGGWNGFFMKDGESTVNPKVAEHIKYAKQLGYDKIQIITNGIMFAKSAFADDCIKAGLNDISFSIHGHTAELHDSLVGVRGAFKKAVKGLLYVKRKYPEVNVCINTCVNKMNYKHLADIIKFFAERGINKFDNIRIMPLGNAFENKKYLFFDVEKAYSYLQKAWKLKDAYNLELTASFFPVEILEGQEDLLYDMENVIDEELSGHYDFKSPFSCYGQACKYCFLNHFCDVRVKYLDKRLSKFKLSLVDINKQKLSDLDPKKKYQLRGYRNLMELKKDWGADIDEFKERLRIVNSKKIKTYNMPKCLNKNSAGYTDLSDYYSGKPPLESLIKIYLEELYRRKSLRCKKCKYCNNCEGIHIGFIQAYGLRVLEPVVNNSYKKKKVFLRNTLKIILKKRKF